MAAKHPLLRLVRAENSVINKHNPPVSLVARLKGSSLGKDLADQIKYLLADNLALWASASRGRGAVEGEVQVVQRCSQGIECVWPL